MVLTGALPSEVNVGYVEFEDSIVDTVDGKAITSLSHLPFLSSRARPEGPSRGIPSNRNGASHRILLEDSECEIVLRHEDVDRRSQEILDRHHIADFEHHLAYSHLE